MSAVKTSDSPYRLCLYFASGALARKAEKLAKESWKPLDLAPSHAYLLMLVLEEPGLQPGALADLLQLEPSTITRLIEKLEQKKLAVRTTEGKITNVYPTPKAKELYPRMKSCVETFNNALAAALGKEESHRVITGINKLSDKLGA